MFWLRIPRTALHGVSYDNESIFYLICDVINVLLRAMQGTCSFLVSRLLPYTWTKLTVCTVDFQLENGGMWAWPDHVCVAVASFPRCKRHEATIAL